MKPNDYDKLYICNGCRPSWLSEHIPDKLEKALAPYFDEIFKQACDEHDICYYIGNTKKDFKKCNKQFYKRMKQSIKRNGNWYSRWWFYYKAWQYYKLVSKFGKSSFYFAETKRILPSLEAEKKSKIEAVWLYNRWWTRKEANKLLFLKE